MSQWQPIATAPKDGSYVLVAHGTRPWITVAKWSDDSPIWDRESVPHWVAFDCEDYFYSVHLIDEAEPTHWMPLPSPPE